MNLNHFFKVLQQKTEEGIEKLKETEIGTDEYQILVNQIISNINLKHDRSILENGMQQGQGQPRQFNPQDVIGKEFN